MSSILDALRKHEREGDPAAQAAGGALDAPMTAEQELAGYRPQAPARHAQLHPAVVAVLAAVVGAALVLVAVAAGAYFARRGSPETVQTASRIPASAPSGVTAGTGAIASTNTYEPQTGPQLKGPASHAGTAPPPSEPPAASRGAAADPAGAVAAKPATAMPSRSADQPDSTPELLPQAAPRQTEPEPPTLAPAPQRPEPVQADPLPQQPSTPAVSAPVPEPLAVARVSQPVMVQERIAVPALKPEPRSEPEPAPPAPETPEVEQPPPAEPARAREPQPVAAEPSPQEQAPQRDRDPSDYPRLSPGDAERLGLPDLRINILSPPSSGKPTWTVMVNYIRLYPGDTIPKTGGAKVIGISERGFALEVAGERYFVARKR